MTVRPILFSGPMVRGLIREVQHPATAPGEIVRDGGGA